MVAAAAAAQADADAANAAVADMAADGVLTPVEKPTLILQNTVLTAEQAGIDAQATAYGITTEKAAYDAALAALAALLNYLSPEVRIWDPILAPTAGVGLHAPADLCTMARTLLPGGGWVIDTPGIRSFGLAHIRPDDVVAPFSDLAQAVENAGLHYNLDHLWQVSDT